MPRIRSGRVIRRPRYAAYTEWPRYTEASYAAYSEWPRYTEAALCRVYAVAALYEDRVIQRAANSEPLMRCYAVSPLYSEPATIQ